MHNCLHKSDYHEFEDMLTIKKGASSFICNLFKILTEFFEQLRHRIVH